MIELRSGIPGSGKTASMVLSLFQLQESWGANPENGRPVFVHNIKDLALPHALLPLVMATSISKPVPDWAAVPDGALVIIDECQDLFPPRSAQSAAPAHISWFNTHRHRGIDIWLSTQHPKLIDFSLRAIVGKHLHFRRLFGGNRSMCYEWDGCSDNLSGMKDAVMSYFPFPKKIYKFYKSAEIHTKQSFRLPRWLLIPLAGLVLGVFLIPNAFNVLTGSIGGHGLGSSKKVEVMPASIVTSKLSILPGRDVAPIAELSPVVPVAVAAVPSIFSGCIMTVPQGCRCYDTLGHVVEKPLEFCIAAVDISRGPPLSLSAIFPEASVRSALGDLDSDIGRSENDGRVLAFMRDRLVSSARSPLLR